VSLSWVSRIQKIETLCRQKGQVYWFVDIMLLEGATRSQTQLKEGVCLLNIGGFQNTVNSIMTLKW